MSWFKVDDTFFSSPKVLSIPRSHRMVCVGLWVIAGTWCAQQMTDGRVPAYMLAEWGADLSQGDILVRSHLWERDGDDFVFHDWVDYQPTRADVLAFREKERQRKEAYRAKKRGKTGQSPDGTDADGDGGQNPESGLPDPTRPDPLTTPNGVVPHKPSKRGSRIPEPFIVTSAMRDWAAMECPSVDVDRATVKFTNYWRAKSGRDATKLDWLATWRNWLMRDNDAAPRRQTPMERAEQTMAAGRMVAGHLVTTLEVEA